APLERMRSLSAEASAAQQNAIEQQVKEMFRAVRSMEQVSGAAVETFRNNMRVLVDEKQVTTRQALGFDIEYAAQVRDQIGERLEALREFDQASLDDRQKALAMMTQLDARYAAAASQDYRA